MNYKPTGGGDPAPITKHKQQKKMKKQTFDFGIKTSDVIRKKKDFTFYDRVQQFKQMKSLLQRVNEMMDQDDVDLMDSMILKSDIEHLLKQLNK